MQSTHIYRFFKSTWGIYVVLTADLASKAEFPLQTIEVTPDIYLSIEVPNLSDIEMDYLALAVKLLKSELQNRLKQQMPVVIRIIDLEIALTDYQPECLTYALVG